MGHILHHFLIFLHSSVVPYGYLSYYGFGRPTIHVVWRISIWHKILIVKWYGAAHIHTINDSPTGSCFIHTFLCIGSCADLMSSRIQALMETRSTHLATWAIYLFWLELYVEWTYYWIHYIAVIVRNRLQSMVHSTLPCQWNWMV